MQITRRNYEEICDSLAVCGHAVRGRIERDRRTPGTREEGTMRQVTRIHRTLVVLAVGLLALAAPLIAYAGDGGPKPG
jgi:hypothetical protein